MKSAKHQPERAQVTRGRPPGRGSQRVKPIKATANNRRLLFTPKIEGYLLFLTGTARQQRCLMENAEFAGGESDVNWMDSFSGRQK